MVNCSAVRVLVGLATTAAFSCDTGLTILASVENRNTAYTRAINYLGWVSALLSGFGSSFVIVESPTYLYLGFPRFCTSLSIPFVALLVFEGWSSYT
jgi:hypothetical protein